MVAGLIYTEVQGSTNPRREVFRVQKSLHTGVESIARMRLRSSVNRIAYANRPGRSLLRSVQKMETDILELRKELDNKVHKSATSTQLLMDELMILRPLQGTAIDIRKRFFATCRRKGDQMEPDDRPTIDTGNLRAHGGDVCLDVYLLKKHLIEYENTFSDLYGVSWLVAESLLGYKKVVYAMNARATTIANRLLWWNPLQEAAFCDLVSWIGIATADQLEQFKQDSDINTDTYPHRLLEQIENAS